MFKFVAKFCNDKKSKYMKNLVSFIFLLALLVSGCSQEEMLKGVTSASSGRIFTTSFEQKDSRTFVKDGYLSRWTANDRISLFDSNTQNLEYKFDGETGDSEGTFSMVNISGGTGSSLTSNYAVYPYSKDVQIAADGKITTTLPSEQHYAENSFGVGDNTMVAVTQNTDDTFLTFKNVCGGLKFQFYGDDVTVKSVILMGNNGELISGNATIKAAYDENPILTMADDATTTITLDCGENGVKIGATADEATAFWMVIPPVTFEKGVTIKVKDMEGKVFTQTIDKQLLTERNVVKPMSAVKAVMTERDDVEIIGIPEEELNGWEEGFLVNDEIFFVVSEDSVGGTIAYFNKLNQNFEDGLLIEYDSVGIIKQIHDHEYIHTLNFTDDSLYVTSVPADINSSLPIKQKEIAFNYKEECNIERLSRVSSKTMDRLSMYYFLHSTGQKAEISNREVWMTVGQAIIEEAIGESIEKGVIKVAGKVAGGIVGGCLLAYDAIMLNEEVKVYTYFGHARLSIEGLGKGLAVNPKEFTVKCENFNTLPSATKYGMVYPFEYECGVLLDGKQHIGPISFKQGDTVNMGTYKMPELPEGTHVLLPYILCKFNGQRVYNAVRFVVEELELPEYSVKIKDISEDGEDIKVLLDFNWTPVSNSHIEYQGIRFTKPNGEKFCLNLSTYTGGNVGVADKTEGRISKSDFKWEGDRGTSYIKIEYWVKFKEVYETKCAFLEDYVVVYDPLREALIKLYQSTNGDNWTNNTNWCSDKPITEWYGVHKIAENNYSLDLSDNNLTGKIDQTFPNDVKITLSCNFNQLTSLNVSGCTALNKLLCVANQLTFLDASGCTALEILRCFNNELTSLNVSGCTSLANLDCSSNQLTSLDVSGCMALTSLDCSNNQLISLDVSDITTLSNMLCFDNQLTTLDVSGCTALTDLWCNDNQLTSLNITGCSALDVLACSSNQLTSLDVSGCTVLSNLNCGYNRLTSLNVSGCTALAILSCDENQLTSLDVSGCTALTDLICDDNQLTSLDVSGCTALETLYFQYNMITSLNASGCTSVTYMRLADGQLTSLDVSGCTALTRLECNSNKLTSLNVSGCTALTELWCYNNQLTFLDVSGCTSLTHLYCHNNKIRSVIPDWFSQLSTFNHDIRFRYWKESVPDGDGGYVTIDRYEDRGIGWWYPGEPGKYEHSPD